MRKSSPLNTATSVSRAGVSVAGVTVLILVTLAVAVPMLVAGILVFTAPATSEQGLAVFFGTRIIPALRFTLLQAFFSTILAVVVAMPAAFLTARRDFPGRRLLLSLSGVPLCVPPVVIALSFVLFYGRQGVVNSLLMTVFSLDTPPLTFLYSLAGVVLAHGLYNFPVVLRTVSQAWERLPAEREEAALLLGARPRRVFFTIILPALAGPILSSAVLVFLYCFFSFVIVLIFGGVGGTTLEVELYQAARSALNLPGAGLIALVETVVAAGIVVLYAWLQRVFVNNRGINVLRTRTSFKGKRELFFSLGYLLLIVIFFAGPLIMITLRSLSPPAGGQYAAGSAFGFSGWIGFFTARSFFPALFSTLIIGGFTAFLATAAALTFALLEEHYRIVGRTLILRIIPLLPLAVSSVVLAFGWTILVPRGSVFVLILAQAAVAWPFAWTQIRASLDSIPSDVHSAALLLSVRPTDALFRIFIPLSWRGILSGAGFAFAISAGDATLPLVLSIPRFENLALLLFRLTGSYRFTEACACAVLLAAITGFVFFLQDVDTGETRPHHQHSFKEVPK